MTAPGETLLVPQELLDMGLVLHFLGSPRNELPEHIALDQSATKIALAHQTKIVVSKLDQSIVQPLSHTKDQVTTLKWIRNPNGAEAQGCGDILLAGYTSGKMRVWSDTGMLIFVVHLHGSPLVQIECVAPDDLLVMFGDGFIAHASQSRFTIMAQNRRDGCSDRNSVGRCSSAHVSSDHGDFDHARSFASHSNDSNPNGPHSNDSHPGDFEDGPAEHLFRVFAIGAVSDEWMGFVSGGELPLPPLEFRKQIDRRPICLTIACTSALQMHLIHVESGRTEKIASPVQNFTARMAKVALESTSSLMHAFGLEHKSLEATSDPVADPIEVLRSKPGTFPTPSRDTELLRIVTDAQRRFISMTVDPSHRWIASSDSLGRVIVLEARSLVMLRIWKGYREAQCEWLCSKGKLFLVIYAPRRGLLEIWEMISGQRHTATIIGPGCRLLSSVVTSKVTFPGASSELRKGKNSSEYHSYVIQPKGTLSKLHVS